MKVSRGSTPPATPPTSKLSTLISSSYSREALSDSSSSSSSSSKEQDRQVADLHRSSDRCRASVRFLSSKFIADRNSESRTCCCVSSKLQQQENSQQLLQQIGNNKQSSSNSDTSSSSSRAAAAASKDHTPRKLASAIRKKRLKQQQQHAQQDKQHQQQHWEQQQQQQRGANHLLIKVNLRCCSGALCCSSDPPPHTSCLFPTAGDHCPACERTYPSPKTRMHSCVHECMHGVQTPLKALITHSHTTRRCIKLLNCFQSSRYAACPSAGGAAADGTHQNCKHACAPDCLRQKAEVYLKRRGTATRRTGVWLREDTRSTS
ncbi:hypothetical protein ACSSS7_005255 [Eimeria intestinalis]